jgi:hypothetical protein
MNEVRVRKIVREEIIIAMHEHRIVTEDMLKEQLRAQKQEILSEVKGLRSGFLSDIQFVMEEFSSQMKTVAEYAQGMHENHENRILALEGKSL